MPLDLHLICDLGRKHLGTFEEGRVGGEVGQTIGQFGPADKLRDDNITF